MVPATAVPQAAPPQAALPEPFASWFASRGWRPHAHQLALLGEVAAGRDALLIAPTGGGKTASNLFPPTAQDQALDYLLGTGP